VREPLLRQRKRDRHGSQIGFDYAHLKDALMAIRSVVYSGAPVAKHAYGCAIGATKSWRWERLTA
jgi:hypothetical protein